MIRKFIPLIGLSLACGGAEPPQECMLNTATGEISCTDLDVQESAEEIGQTSEALSSDIGYGQDGANKECYVPWATGTCLVPKDKILKYFIAPCVPLSGNDKEACQAIESGASWWLAKMQERGFTVSQVPAGTKGLDTTIQIGALPGKYLGQAAQVWQTADNVPGPGGVFGKFFRCDITLDMQKVKNGLNDRSIYPAVPTSLQRLYAYENNLMHELGHCSGLGHHESGTPLNVMASAWPDDTVLRQYDSFQNAWLSHYLP